MSICTRNINAYTIAHNVILLIISSNKRKKYALKKNHNIFINLKENVK